jgi:S-formylglutathione hydrolase
MISFQGSEDEYLQYLLPKKLVESATENPKGKDVLSVQLRMQDGYDHSYYFVASFIEDHFKHHAKILNQL